MESMRDFDIVVFGASGFTGQVVLEEAVKYRNADGSLKYRLAAAGRSYHRIITMLDALSKKINHPTNLSESIPILIGDSDKYDSLVQICKRARLVINCVGPFRFYGEAVVRACVTNGTDYVDICGEPQFIEAMQYKYNEDAQKNDCIVISSCGFDSIPADVGVLLTAQALAQHSTPTSVESFLTVKAGPAGSSAHYTTWESAVHGFGDHQQLSRLRQGQPKITVPVIGQRLQRRDGAFFDNRINLWSLPFPGADAAVVRRTQQISVSRKLESHHPVQYAAYFTVSSFRYLALTMLVGGMFKVFSSFSFGRKMLLKYPSFFSLGLFTHEGPTEEQRKQTTFTMTFYGKGYKGDQVGAPDHEVVASFSGVDPGYTATAAMIFAAARTIVDEKKSIPVRGAVTPGAAFRGTNLVKRLEEAGVVYRIHDQGSTSQKDK